MTETRFERLLNRAFPPAPDPLPSVPKTHRWNVEESSDGIKLCRGQHQSGEACEWEYYVPEYTKRAVSPLPEEPRKCPTCGTKLIPAAQAFSEIRERITAEKPPINQEELRLYGAFTFDPDRVEPPDIEEAIEALDVRHLQAERKAIAEEFGVSEDFDLGEHARVVMASLDDFRAERERLKADQLTPAMAEAIIVMADWRGFSHPPPLHLPEGTLALLRRLSQSDP